MSRDARHLPTSTIWHFPAIHRYTGFTSGLWCREISLGGWVYASEGRGLVGGRVYHLWSFTNGGLAGGGWQVETAAECDLGKVVGLRVTGWAGLDGHKGGGDG